MAGIFCCSRVLLGGGHTLECQQKNAARIPARWLEPKVESICCLKSAATKGKRHSSSCLDRRKENGELFRPGEEGLKSYKMPFEYVRSPEPESKEDDRVEGLRAFGRAAYPFPTITTTSALTSMSRRDPEVTGYYDSTTNTWTTVTGTTIPSSSYFPATYTIPATTASTITSGYLHPVPSRMPAFLPGVEPDEEPAETTTSGVALEILRTEARDNPRALALVEKLAKILGAPTPASAFMDPKTKPTVRNDDPEHLREETRAKSNAP